MEIDISLDNIHDMSIKEDSEMKIAPNVPEINAINSLKIVCLNRTSSKFPLIPFNLQLKDIKSLGCSDLAINAATYRIYLDLCEVRKYEDVTYHFLKEFDLLYFKACKKLDDDNKSSEKEIIVPVLAAKKISFKQIEFYQKVFNSNSINLAICDSNYIMYYKLSQEKGNTEN